MNNAETNNRVRKNSMVIRRGQIESLLSLNSAKDIKTILRAMLSYGMDDIEPEIPEHLAFGWIGFKHTIDNDKIAYAEKADKRREAANKRWHTENANDANASNCMQTMQMHVLQCKRMQTHANDADIDNDNGNINDITNSVCVSHAHAYVRECEYAEDAERIARAYPQGKTGSFRDLLKLVMDAIARETDLPGATTESAIAKVENGTLAYARAMKDTPKRYLAKPEDFFGEARYAFDPSVWERKEAVGNINHPDVLRKNTAFAANERGLVK